MTRSGIVPSDGPKRVVLATMGTLGDLYPFIAIAAALRRRGFQPVIVSQAMHRRSVEREGIEFALLRPNESEIADALGVDTAGAFRMMLKNPHFILDEILLRFLPQIYEDVMRAAAGADIVITQSLLVGALQAAEALGLPSARIALAPLHLQSAAGPSVTPSAPYIVEPKTCCAVSYNRMVRAAVRSSVDLRMGRLRAFRRRVGLPPSSEDFFLDFGRANGANAVFGLFSPHFAPRQPDHPGNLEVPGFPFYEAADAERRALDPALEAFLASGDAPVIFTLGSFAPDCSGDFYDRSLLAVRALGRRAVLLAGVKDTARLASRVGPRDYVCERAPHALLFPRGSCVVHHGGIGTTAEALRAAKPQIVVPFFGDQTDNGVRIDRLGLGCTIKLADYDEHRAANALQRLASGSYSKAAARFATLMAADRGVQSVVDWADAMVHAGGNGLHQNRMLR